MDFFVRLFTQLKFRVVQSCIFYLAYGVLVDLSDLFLSVAQNSWLVDICCHSHCWLIKFSTCLCNSALETKEVVRISIYGQRLIPKRMSGFSSLYVNSELWRGDLSSWWVVSSVLPGVESTNLARDAGGTPREYQMIVLVGECCCFPWPLCSSGRMHRERLSCLVFAGAAGVQPDLCFSRKSSGPHPSKI